MGKNFPKISDQEFGYRMSQFKTKMAAEGFDLVVVFSNLLDPSAVRYFTDVSPINESAGLVIPLEGEPIMCSGQACHEWSRHKSKVKEIRILPEVGEVSGVEYDIADQQDFEDLFREMKSKYTVKKIGIIGDLIFPYEIYKKLEKVFFDSEKTSAEMLMYEMRMRKSPSEIECIKKAAEIITETMEYAVPRIGPGVTELDIQADIESQILRLGAESYCMSFSPMIPTGPENSNLCMNRNTLRQVKAGEIIDIAAGACYEGYNGVICTPVVLGDIPEDICKAVRVAYEGLNLVTLHMKPGASSMELYNIYNEFLTDKGYREFSPYGSVHSIGMLECETPFFSASKEVVMLKNMAVAIDAYFKDLPWGSFRIEDTFTIRESGAELVTGFNKKHILKTFA